MKLANYIKAAFGITIGYELGKLVTKAIFGCTDKVCVRIENKKAEKEKANNNE